MQTFAIGFCLSKFEVVPNEPHRDKTNKMAWASAVRLIDS